MTAAEDPLTAQEERLWRALMRVIVALPRSLDDDLLRATGLTLTEYVVLMSLSEAENHELRMADLAAATALSASRITRVVDALQSRGQVVKRRYEGDARGNVATLTPEGLKRLQAAYPIHLASARKRVMDHLDGRSLAAMVRQFETVVEKFD
ncbi:MarR family winged helix-turn-helix transcriptional regulator [Streptomyces prunicolor]|jgi:DNA-binding MarR family transcriptional regulator|uniref:MarR family transcriptional regulator n=1 Tax=Streptomyces prunicolor TaxID=67348 RepID=A0ABU4F674_9ACTN|nr:MarR family transcriptional regulator [Streptomyces prunicolor]MCX5242816.1 MarR family transcriptional regulator [Streptomyces prunicolor]MDV7216087.1 MarR family transcriptional regulator [Streptomyces prunicolor]